MLSIKERTKKTLMMTGAKKPVLKGSENFGR